MNDDDILLNENDDDRLYIDTDSESFQQFNDELRGKLSSKLYDRIQDLKVDVARNLSNRVNGNPDSE